MKRWKNIGPIDRWIEPVLAIVILVALVRVYFYLQHFGHLPQPFFYDSFDIWGDGFNTAVWAREVSLYDSWGSIYPPLTFVIMRMIGNPACYINASAYSARECDWISIAAFHALYVFNIILISLTYLKIERRTALPRSFALAAGLPMLMAMERGNIIVLCFTCMLLGYGPLLKAARWRWIAVGMTVNFKIYLVAALFPQLIKRRWLWFEGSVIATIGIYLATLALLGRGTPGEIYVNITRFTEIFDFQLLDLWAAASFAPTLSLVTSDFPLGGLIGTANVELITWVLPLTIRCVQAAIILAVAFAWFRPEAVPMYRLTGLSVLFVIITIETGGYSPAFFILFVFMEPWRGFGRRLAIILCYVACFPFDIILDRAISVVQESYFGGGQVKQDYYIMLGFFLRPAINLVVAVIMSSITIREVWQDVRHPTPHGRWRFRRDAKLFGGAETEPRTTAQTS